jgi:protein tyrosine phosphatase
LRDSLPMQIDFDNELRGQAATFLALGNTVLSRIVSIDAGPSRDSAVVSFELRISQGTTLNMQQLISGMANRRFTIPQSSNGFSQTTPATFCARCFTFAFEPVATTLPPVIPATQQGTASDDGSDNTALIAVVICIALVLCVCVCGAIFFVVGRHRQDSENLDSKTTVFNTVHHNLTFDESLLHSKSTARRASYAGAAEASSDNFTAGRQKFNAPKNRSQDRLPYNETRVFLQREGGGPGSDYINASFVHMRGDSCKYIATQGPLKHTVDDFWLMVAQQKCSAIAMLSADDGDSVQYWPASGTATYGLVSVTANAEDVKDGFVVRRFTVSTVDTTQEVTHVQYLEWPGQGEAIDTRTFLAFRREVLLHEDAAVPTVVHCSSGCGRTGVYLCADSELKHFSKKSRADLHESVASARRGRPMMVETALEYVYLHTIAVDAIVNEPPTPIARMQPDAAVFVAELYIPQESQANFHDFDIGRPGRKVLRVGTFSSAKHGTRKGKAVASDRSGLCIALCNDVVIIAIVQRGGSACALDSVALRSDVAVQPAGALGFKIKAGKQYPVTCRSTQERDLWLREIYDLQSFITTDKLAGRRMSSLRPSSHEDALMVLSTPDPTTERGITALKLEFQSIPRVFKKDIAKDSAIMSGAAGPNFNFGRRPGNSNNSLRINDKFANPMFSEAAPHNDSATSWASPAASLYSTQQPGEFSPQRRRPDWASGSPAYPSSPVGYQHTEQQFNYASPSTGYRQAENPYSVPRYERTLTSTSSTGSYHMPPSHGNGSGYISGGAASPEQQREHEIAQRSSDLNISVVNAERLKEEASTAEHHLKMRVSSDAAA